MSRRRPFRAPKAPPMLWQALLTEHLGASPQTAQELWTTYVATDPLTSQALRFNLDRLAETAPSAGVWEQRYDTLRGALTPRLLLDLCVRLSPEGGPRRWDVVRLEEAILSYTRQDGSWD
jgi:hypothetical protein